MRRESCTAASLATEGAAWQKRCGYWKRHPVPGQPHPTPPYPQEIAGLQSFVQLPAWASRSAQSERAGLPNGRLLGNDRHMLSSALDEASDQSSWSVRQLVDKLRSTADSRLLARYCERLIDMERPSSVLAAELMGTVAICVCAYLDDKDLVVAACKLWEHLCSGYGAEATARKHSIASVGAIEAVMDGMRHFPDEIEVQFHSCAAIASACRCSAAADSPVPRTASDVWWPTQTRHRRA